MTKLVTFSQIIITTKKYKYNKKKVVKNFYHHFSFLRYTKLQKTTINQTFTGLQRNIRDDGDNSPTSLPLLLLLPPSLS
ncbi:Uncharacterized protein TCM_002344 [Theobroma cacao]|uniref:Uncharacterized protein n=1 Tax=Theobroma cacao TaxID=3641 RepID=A0A061DM25_THECC|nr:Uncharacterized protein TCM_002344 [Theobroma cacao]